MAIFGNLFSNLGQMTVAQNVLANRWRYDLQRRQEAQDKLDIYRDYYEHIILETLQGQYCPENFDRLKVHVNQSQNILKRIINEISMVYKVEARRGILKGESPRWEEIKRESDLAIKMKKVNRYTNLFNECMVKIGVRDNHVVYDIITPAVCGIIQNDDNPTQVDAVWYQVISYDPNGLPNIEYYYYDIDGTAQVLNDKHVPSMTIYTPDDTPFRDGDGKTFIPVVPFHRTEPEDLFWDRDTGRDLVNAAVAIGCKMTLMDYYFKNASHRQIYMIGENLVPGNMVLDPLTVLTAEQGPNGHAAIGVLDVQNRMQDLINALVFQINSVINNYGISADMWSLNVGETSGRALKIRNRALLEAREDQLPLYREYEKQLFEKTKWINNHLLPGLGTIDEKAEEAVDFGEIDFPEDPGVEIDLLTKKLQAGLISVGQFYQYFNPDIDDEEKAQELFLNNIHVMNKLRQENPDLDKTLNDIMGSQPPKVTPNLQGVPRGA